MALIVTFNNVVSLSAIVQELLAVQFVVLLLIVALALVLTFSTRVLGSGIVVMPAVTFVAFNKHV